MARVKTGVKKVRKNWQLPEKHIAMIKELQDMLGFESEQEVIRYVIGQSYYLESAIKKDGCWVVIRDKDGDRAITFK